MVGAIRYYNPELFDRLTGHIFTRAQLPRIVAEPPPAKRQRPKRTHASRIEASNSGTSTPTLSAAEGKVNKKRKIISAPTEDKVVARTTEGQQVTLPRDEDEDMSNKEFAQQLAKAQAGTKFEHPKTQGQTKKERRAAAIVAQGKQNGVAASELSTETSSANGREADDDLSPVGSSSTGPVSTAPTSRAGDVSDMLEAPTVKPGVLRLTDVKGSGSKSATKPSQAFQPALTKKQRQRQSKAAEQKALRDESDRIHEQKKQAQLRTARMGEGSSNQTKANVFTAKQSAWQSGKPASEELTQKSANDKVVPLLDTFEEKTQTTVPAHGGVTSEPMRDITNTVAETANVNEVRQGVGEGKTTALAASDREKVSRPGLASQASWADEVNEDEQDKWAHELAQEEQWESVTNKKGKKKSKKDNADTSSEASSSLARPVSTGNPLVNGNHTNGVGKPRTENANRFQTIEPMANSSFKDAEWEA